MSTGQVTLAAQSGTAASGAARSRGLAALTIAPPLLFMIVSFIAPLLLLAAISLRQLSYDLDAGLLTLLPIPLHDTRRLIGITRRTDSMVSPGAKILMEEIARRYPPLLAPIEPSQTIDAAQSGLSLEGTETRRRSALAHE